MKRLFLYAPLLLLTQCSKCKDGPQPKNPEDALPPATQEGKNTLGCLINGQPWTPKGHRGSVPNFYVWYDPSYAGGAIDIRTYRYPKSGDSRSQYIAFGGGGVAQAGTYLIGDNGLQAYISDEFKAQGCQDVQSDDPWSTVYCRGQLLITRLDVAAGVVSGTFGFVLAKPGCDTIKVTQGRFDRKL
ncbi:hypothetical protein LJ737_03280 [Hymenobacter sp. 15J16-1T3B]|uniref:hypothetical protein n=1 Tax=Hymenobacter sp. 15J16-1T3B TaxID=2886941 RepID=UPI001D0F7080|nr:hypothetical protein [Hymenobacter sp. 15J16-1T3B]MCC3156241.1 hypothetical protein [Hymenobacter sp. 15J16-1T3B]